MGLKTMLRDKLKLTLSEAPAEPWTPPELPALPAAAPAGTRSLSVTEAPAAVSKPWTPPETLPSVATGTVGRWHDLPMMCGVHHRPFVVEVELRGDVVFLVRNRPSADGPVDGGASVREALGRFRYVNARIGWRCPHCGTRDNPAMGLGHCWRCCDNLICAGTIGRSAYCACGELREREWKNRPAATEFELSVRRAAQPAAAELPRLSAPSIQNAPRLGGPSTARPSTLLLPGRR